MKSMQENLGPRARTFKRLLSAHLGEAEARRILGNVLRLQEHIGGPEQPSRQGLLFGQIQSGKTNHMLMAVALASDAGHRLFIILTSDNTWLYEQTLERARQALPGLLVLGKSDWEAGSLAPRIEIALRHTGLVLVATKNRRILERLQAFIERYCSPNLRTVIFDDEADQASLNTLVNQDTEELSAINYAITALREYFSAHVYVQVTATPQALFLQSTASPFAPQFTVAFEPGNGYVGGEAFFEQEGRGSPMRLFPDEEVEALTSPDPGASGGSGLAVPTGLRQALCYFFTAAATKLLCGEGACFSCLCHISHRQEAHRALEAVVNRFITRLIQALLDESAPDRDIAVEYLREAYADMCRTREQPPSFEDICREIRDNIAGTQIQVLIAGSEYRRPTYNAPFNILVGGNRLGRGVTIERLLVTYYGRTSRAPQIDTVLQHARMYGYRRRDMDVIRFFISESLLDVFINIYRSERQLRTMVQRCNPADMHAVVLSRTTHGILRPTRPNVIYLDALAFYMPGERYFPLAPLSKNVPLLDQMLLPFDGRKEPAQVPIDFLAEIVNLTESEEAPGSSWDDEAIKVCLKNMREMYANRGFLVVRTNRDISRGSRAMLSPDDYKLFDPSGPTLTMYRYNGRREQGWDGNPRWVPNLRFPDGNTYFMFSVF